MSPLLALILAGQDKTHFSFTYLTMTVACSGVPAAHFCDKPASDERPAPATFAGSLGISIVTDC